MHQFTSAKQVAHTAHEMFDLVADVEAYPEFVPLCQALKVRGRRDLEEDRAMLILKHAEGYSYQDLAEMFDLSVSACKMRLSRARDKLKKRFPNQLN